MEEMARCRCSWVQGLLKCLSMMGRTWAEEGGGGKQSGITTCICVHAPICMYVHETKVLCKDHKHSCKIFNSDIYIPYSTKFSG